MADQVTPQGETPETPQAEPPAQDAGEKFDADRAMDLIKKLRGEIKDLTPKAKKAAEFEAAEAKRKDAEMTETEKLNKQLAEAQSRLQRMEHIEKQRAAAEKVGLPATFAKRLQGETPEELEADAKDILDSLPKTEKRPPVLNPTNPSGGAQGETLDQQRARVYGASSNLFDPGIAPAKGGGVFWIDKDNK